MSEQSPNDQFLAVERTIGEIQHADGARLAELRVDLLGRKAGRLTQILRSLSSLPSEERRVVGLRANDLKREIESALASRESEVASRKASKQVADLTMPGRSAWRGAIHPVTAVVDEICEIFRDLGFTRVSGPEAETQEYNFTKLNISLDHPAADMQDTMFLSPGIVMRTHTSPVQARTMEQYEPPIRIVVPGLVYRRDAFDASHAPVFEQIEGLVVDEGVSFVDFKAAIDFFVKRFFSKTTAVRFRPSFFPFTEPSAEVDVKWGDGWLEIMGAGMVHPAVLENCGIDSERYTGYAFGMGPHRITMLRHGIPDIRLLFQNDMRFLGQFVE
ncbi:MAG: phenylalanine--tRNA ligase subunit alpha [Gemmatimonadetes bacterium]|nr:phenylalanine--tRNA ligase subunit alpha [Gemmatimonadota bacterium]